MKAFYQLIKLTLSFRGFWLSTLERVEKRKEVETMPTLNEFKENILALLDIINER